MTYARLRQTAADEAKEKVHHPDQLTVYAGNVERGISDPTTGWRYQGFIEDRSGELRPQTLEETIACMGRHGGIGATTDTNFSFPRKVVDDGTLSGWYHWSQRGLAGLNEPKVEIAGAGVHYEGQMEPRRQHHRFRLQSVGLGSDMADRRRRGQSAPADLRAGQARLAALASRQREAGVLGK